MHGIWLNSWCSPDEVKTGVKNRSNEIQYSLEQSNDVIASGFRPHQSSARTNQKPLQFVTI